MKERMFARATVAMLALVVFWIVVWCIGLFALGPTGSVMAALVIAQVWAAAWAVYAGLFLWIDTRGES